MDVPQDFNSLQDQIQAALIAATRTVGQISSEDLSFQRSLDAAVGASLDEQSARLLALASSLLKSTASISELRAPVLQDVEDVDNNWQGVVDVVDSLLEKADTCLDEYTGVIKRQSPTATEQSSSKSKRYQSLGNSLKTQNLVKPQLAFQNKPDNVSVTPWKPLLKSKPHAIVPLDKSLGTFTDDLEHQQYKHPYETEILKLHYPDAVYSKAEPVPYLPVDSTTATFVDTFDGVLAMLEELKKAKEIAVDLEHHDARSYIGLVSLMQISTREKDWIVDTLKPWREDLQVLNQVFADPCIIKVFHGAYMDIVWLQRDLGLYVVGLFDTHHASRVLGYPGGSLAYLLKRFIDFDADKKYQMADWRIRPLPDEMFFYARADTHYLLYIYDNLRNELLDGSNQSVPEENKIEHVLQRSKETSLLRFQRQIYDEDTGQGPAGWYQLLVKTPALLNNEQFAVFRAIHAWRDRIARKDDDSTSFVMPNHVIFTLAKAMPVDMTSFYGAVHPISHNVKSRASELLALIKSAKEAGQDGPTMMDVLRPDSVGAAAKANGTKSRNPYPAVSPILASADQGRLRSEKSVFWGTAFGSSIWDPSPATSSSTTHLRLAVPLPQVASELMSDSPSMDSSQLRDSQLPSSIAEKITSTQATNTSEEEVFVIKSGRKRKAQELDTVQQESEGPSGEYDISLNEEEEEAARIKAAEKAEKKAQKKAKKAAKKLASQNASGDATPDQVEEEEPFDYGKADSVLHGKGKDAGNHDSKRKKPFDPYAKSADAPKGMRRLQTERAGKSFTFKS